MLTRKRAFIALAVDVGSNQRVEYGSTASADALTLNVISLRSPDEIRAWIKFPGLRYVSFTLQLLTLLAKSKFTDRGNYE